MIQSNAQCRESRQKETFPPLIILELGATLRSLLEYIPSRLKEVLHTVGSWLGNTLPQAGQIYGEYINCWLLVMISKCGQ